MLLLNLLVKCLMICANNFINLFTLISFFIIMQKSFIVEKVEANLDKITCLSEAIIEGINFRLMNAQGVWHVNNEDDLYNEVEAYIGVPLASLSYCKNQPHKLTAFM